jgi:hypothetical protein
MITHNPEAAAYADRIVHMRDGHVVSEERTGAPDAPGESRDRVMR